MKNPRASFLRLYFLGGLLVPVLFGCATHGPMAPPVPTEIVSGSSLSGAALFSPPALYHEVAPMETLWRIGKMYGVGQKEIIRANKLSNPESIHVGQKLLIPNAQPLRPVIPLYRTRSWQYIVIHHSATHQGNALTIDVSHQRRGFEQGMGYHFLIDNGTLGKRMGQIEAGPRWIKQEDGAHANAAGMNQYGIGISLVGNFSKERVPDAQMESLVFLVSTLQAHYRIPLSHVIRHSDVPGKNTECPGIYFPWNSFKRELQKVARS